MKFSVLLPTRNRLDLLSRAIETVRRQDYSDWEIIVSDNFSEEDVAGYIRTLGDPRIKYFRTEQFVPVTDNWNNAINQSRGDYVIMLGDDDGLMRGYFSTLNRYIQKFDSPDFIYTNAFLYAYPGVMPDAPDGFLRTYSRREIFQSAHEPFWLGKDKAMEFVQHSLNFRVRFDYNMQFSLVNRRLIEKMMQHGPFYQSPFPDYYATNAIMLEAECILIVPQPLVTIGISPKSFGFYYFNDAEPSGNSFLNNAPDKDMVNRLQKVILPGSVMNTSWLISMETLALNFSRQFDLRVSYSRYRTIQILSVYEGMLTGKESAKSIHKQLKKKMTICERLFYGIVFSPPAKKSDARLRVILSNRIRRLREFFSPRLGSHPAIHLPTVEGKFKTILDVFEQVDPHSYLEAPD
ncbi:MAG: glycosyltransferase [Nitrosomonadales bacterium]|nr:glycosyltransferase [Nitrosomonadales bacterium]